MLGWFYKDGKLNPDREEFCTYVRCVSTLSVAVVADVVRVEYVHEGVGTFAI